MSTVTALGQSISGSSGLTSYGYLPNTGDRRLATITFNAAPASNETLTSDDADRVDCRTNASGGSAVAETYSYDLADRLTLGTVATTGSACGGTTAYTESYGLNNADFISSKSGESTASNNWAATNPGSVNAIGTLTPSGGTGLTYSYDANGNVLSDGTRNYTWDAENRLLTITEIATGHVSTFAYDGLGRRTAITESGGGGTTYYLWCGTTLCSSYNSSGATLDRFLPWGEVDSGTSTYYERDHLGTVVSTTNTSGTTEATLGTDAYGFTLSSSGTAPTFGYAGMFLHQASGLYLTLYRAYDPYSGRWLSRDPSGESGGVNLYAYVTGDPINQIDPLGLCGASNNGCSVSAASLDNYLATKNSPLVGQGANLMSSGKLYNIDPRLFVSLSGAETTFGKNITAGKFNAFNVLYNGLNSPFVSFKSAINSVGHSLANPQNGYDLTNTTTMYGHYCSGAGCSSGLQNLNAFMNQQGANTNSLHYPCP